MAYVFLKVRHEGEGWMRKAGIEEFHISKQEGLYKLS